MDNERFKQQGLHGSLLEDQLHQHVSGCCGSLRARTCHTAPGSRSGCVTAYGSGRWRERAPLAPFGPLSARAAPRLKVWPADTWPLPAKHKVVFVEELEQVSY